MLFELLSVAHLAFWAFVCFAWLTPSTAALNAYYVVPLTYAVHALPFHVLTALKTRVRPSTWKADDAAVRECLGLAWFVDLQQSLEKKCTFSPISPQGLLVWGMISSVWALRVF